MTNPQSEIRRHRLTLRLFIVIVVLTSGCNYSAPPQPAIQSDAPAKLSVVTPQQKTIHRVIEQPGTIQAFEETPLYAKVAGYVAAVKVDIGDRVRGPHMSSPGKPVEPGQILAEISVPELEEEGQQKQALVKQAEVGIEQSKKALVSSEASVAVVESALHESQSRLSRAQANYDRWESESRRVSGLVRDHVIDEQTRDETNNQLRAAESARNEANANITSAEAQVRRAKAEHEKAGADVRGAEARLQVAQADHRRIEAMLQYTKIRAPFDGVITRRNIDTGHFLQPSGGKNESLFTVVRVDPVRIFIDVPESDAALVSDGCESRVIVQALRGEEIVGKVTRTSWALQPGARTLRAEIDLANPQGRLRPGMYVYTRVNVELPATWTLPASAFSKQGDKTVCYRAVDGKANRIEVLLGQSDGEWTQALKWRNPRTLDWQNWQGDEQIVGNAVSVTDGQTIH